MMLLLVKQLLDTKAETVTIFAFAAGQGLSEHAAPFEAMVSIIDGDAEITIDSKSIHLKAGEMVHDAWLTHRMPCRQSRNSK